MSTALLVVKTLAIVMIVMNFVMALCVIVKDARFDFFLPSVVYDNISVNRFGAWFISILLQLTFPIIVIWYWICKAFTTGRK